MICFVMLCVKTVIHALQSSVFSLVGVFVLFVFEARISLFSLVWPGSYYVQPCCPHTVTLHSCFLYAGITSRSHHTQLNYRVRPVTLRCVIHFELSVSHVSSMSS